MIAVAARGVGRRSEVDWDEGMFRRAVRGGRMAQHVRADSREDDAQGSSVFELLG